MGGLQNGGGTNHSSFNGPSVGLDVNDEFLVEMDWFDATNTLQSASRLITFSSASDLEAKVEDFLTDNTGGVWQVSANVSGSQATITGIVGTNQTFVVDFLSFTQDSGNGNFSDHNFTTQGYVDPYIDAAINLIATALGTDSNTPCTWEGAHVINGNGLFLIDFAIGASQIDLTIEILDGEDAQIAAATFRYSTAPIRAGGYQCDREYSLTRLTGSSGSGPSNGGPAPAPVADWSGVVNAAMNNGAGAPLP